MATVYKSAPVSKPPDLFDNDLRRRRFCLPRYRHAPVNSVQISVMEDLAERAANMAGCYPRVLILGPIKPGSEAILGTCRPEITSVTVMSPTCCTDVVTQSSKRQDMQTSGAHSGCYVADVDLERLPFAENSFDIVFSVLAMHWLNDLPRGMDQIRRVLAPGGLCLAALSGPGSLLGMRRALDKLEPGRHPRVIPMPDIRDVGAIAQRVRFVDVVVDCYSMVLGTTCMRETIAWLRADNSVAAAPTSSRLSMSRDTARALLSLQDFDGEKIEIIALTGWHSRTSFIPYQV